MLAAIILGVVQGLTEFLPVSSTAHLVVLPWFMKWEGSLNTLAFDVALHAGTLVSLLVVFGKDLAEMLSGRRRLLLLLVVGTVPAGAAGLLLEDYVSGSLRQPWVISFALVFFGAVMYYAERFGKDKKIEKMTLADSIAVGLAQAVALVPGTSRSGITIAAGLVRGVKREEAAKFSFLLSIPVVAGATILEGRKLFAGVESADLSLAVAGFVSSMLTGFLAIKFMLGYLRSHNMNAFVIYRFALAGVIMGWIWLGG